MAIIWNKTAQPDSFPIELSEDKDIDDVIKEAEEDESAAAIIQEIEALPPVAPKRDLVVNKKAPIGALW